MRLILLILLAPAVAAADVPTDVVSEVEVAVAKVDPKTPIGEMVTGGTTPATQDVEADIKAIRAGLVAKGYAILALHEDRLTVAIKRARVTIWLNQRGGTFGITPHPSATVAPGKCVAIPKVTHTVDADGTAIDDGGELREGTTHWNLRTEYSIDVDGDGIPDAFVPQPKTKTDCPEEVMWRVYAMRGTCGHDLGVVGPGMPQAPSTALTPSGFRTLVAESVTTRLGGEHVPDHITTTSRYAVSHGAYALVDTKREVGRCHHCATWTCRPSSP